MPMGWIKEALKAFLPSNLMDVALRLNRNHLMMFKQYSYSSEGEDSFNLGVVGSSPTGLTN